MKKSTNKRQYYYIVTLDAPLWPRKLMDELSFTPGIWDHLVAVTDVQNSTHAYGDTYYRGRVNITYPPKPNVGGPADLVASLTRYCNNVVQRRRQQTEQRGRPVSAG
jgi:hypothetical protein